MNNNLFFCLVVFSLFFIFVISEETSFSMFHFSESTFLNLKKFSNPSSLEYHFKIFSKREDISEDYINILARELNTTTILRIPYGIIFQNSTLFDVVLKAKVLKIPFFKSPNGHREYQGWILSEKDYYTKEQEEGDLPKVLHVINKFESLGIYQKGLTLNVKIPNSSSLLRDLMVNYYRKENRKHTILENNFRQKDSYSKVFIEKLLNVKNGLLKYNPSLDQLFDDFIIRQTVDIVGGIPSIWYEDINTARSKFLDLIKSKSFKYPKYGLDISPILLEYKKDDEISKRLSHYIDLSNSIQFNEFFGKVDTAIKRAVGFVKVTELYGPIVADSAVSQISYIEKPMIKKIREKLKRKKPIYIKYIVWDSEACPQIYKEKHKNDEEFYNQQDFILGHIATNIHGISPLIIPNAVVWHQRTEHRFNLLGEYNPALINYNLLHLLENKYLESLFWNEYCPNFLPKTVLLYHLLPNGTNPNDVSPELFVELANKTFPNGWIIKGVWDYNGILHVTTHLSNFTRMIHEYRNSKFDSIVKKYKENLPGCEPIEDLNTYLKDEKHFRGWKNNQYLKDSTSCTIQEFRKAKREYRIECYGGDCPLEGMSSDFFFSHLDSIETESEYRTSLNEFFMKCIKSLPPALQHIPLTSDLAETFNGKRIVYETNPGGNSWLIHHELPIAEVHNHYLKKYPQKHDLIQMTLPIKNGLSSIEQIKYIKELLKKWNVDINIISKRFKILRDRITDEDHVILKPINLNQMNETGPQIKPPRVVNDNQKYFSITRVLHLLQNNQSLIETEGSILLEILYPYMMNQKDLKKSHFKYINEYRMKLQENIQNITKLEMKELLKFDKFKEFSKIQFFKVLSVVLPKMKMIHFMRMLNIKYQEYENLILKLFNKLISNERYQSFLVEFKSFDSKKIDELIIELDDLKKEEETLIKLNNFLDQLTKNFEMVYHIERNGLTLPGISLKSLLNTWMLKMNSLYIEFYTYQQYNSLGNTLIKLISLTTKILQILSDHSLYKLEKNLYLPSYEFLKKAIPAVIQQNNNPSIVGEVIHTLKLFGEENLTDYQFYLVYKQSKFGYWKTPGQSLLESTKECVRALMKYQYSLKKDNEEFLNIVSQEEYMKKMRELGFFISY